MSPTRDTLHAIQVYRGLAALLVALFHGHAIVSLWYGVEPYSGLFISGYSGVYLFFTLSGFIILFAHLQDLGKPHRYIYYLSRRLIRIYPLYWLVFFIWGGWRILANKFPLDDFLLNAFLFSTNQAKPTLIVAWTLLYEIIFYGLFSVAIFNRSWGVAAILLWFVAIIANHYYAFASIPILNDFSLLFIFGLAAGVIFLWARQLLPSLRNILGITSFILGLAIFCAAMAQQSRQIPVFGFASALLLLAPLSTSLDKLLSRRKFLVFLGDASFSIYLVHNQCEKIAYNAVKRLYMTYWPQSEIAADTLLLVILAIGIGAGIIVHLKIERPLLAFLREWLANLGKSYPILARDTV